MRLYANVELLSITPEIDNLIEKCGRVCYQSQDKIAKDSNVQFIGKIIKSGHESVLEHGLATLLISRVSRALTHQLVRHRIASYSQKSQRYVNEIGFEYVTPPAVDDNPVVKQEYNKILAEICKFYAFAKQNGIKAEDCRFLIPNACTSQIAVTQNIRSWRHFLNERLAAPSQWEIKILACCIYKLLSSYTHCLFDLKDRYELAVETLKTQGIKIDFLPYYDENNKISTIEGARAEE